MLCIHIKLNFKPFILAESIEKDLSNTWESQHIAVVVSNPPFCDVVIKKANLKIPG